jgi:predicted permease
MKFDDELDREIQDHLELEAEERAARGAAPDEAWAAARRRFGNVGLVKEAVRATQRWAVLDVLRQDLRYALRGLMRSPAFTVTAIVSLALGIGANTAVFTLINALLLRALPVNEPGRLMQLSLVDSGKTRQNFSLPVIHALAKQPNELVGLCGFALGETFAVGDPGSSQRVNGTWMTADCYRVLGVRLSAGRGFSGDDDRPNAGNLVAVVNDNYWRRELGAAPDAVGKQIVIDGHPVTIIGVTGPGFTGPNVGRTADITMPVSAFLRLRPDGPPILRTGINWLRLFGRLAPGVRAEHAEAGINVGWQRIIDATLPPESRATARSARLTLTPGGTGWSELRSQFTKPLVVLMGIVVLVLLIACANLASLLLARASARQREFAVRLAIGAGRGRLIRQVLTESFLLAVAGGVAAVAFAQVSSRALVSALSAGRSRPIALDVHADLRVLAFALGVMIVTNLLFGLAPAFRATAVDEASALYESARARGTRRGRLASILVVAQAALSLLLVVGAALFARTLSNLLSVDTGFRSDGVTLVSVEISRAARDSATQAMLAQETVDRLQQLPGVTAASISRTTPLSGGGWTLPVTRDDAPTASNAEAEMLMASPSYFTVFGIAVRAGREFSRADGLRAPRVAILNEALARERFGAASPIGRRIRIGEGQPPFEIVGVVQNVASEGPRKPARPAVYLSFFQMPTAELSGGATIALRTDHAAIGEQTVRASVHAAVPFADVSLRSFKSLVDASLLNERLLAMLAEFFALLALALAAIGLYGLLAFRVSRRTTEIGIRTALGATSIRVVWLVMSDALRLVGAGLVLGLPAVWATTRVIGGMLYGLSPTDATAIAIAVALNVLTALVAAYLPVRRALRIPAIVALKCE